MPNERRIHLKEEMVYSFLPGRVENHLDQAHPLVDRVEKGSIDGVRGQTRQSAHTPSDSESRASASSTAVGADVILKCSERFGPSGVSSFPTPDSSQSRDFPRQHQQTVR